MFVDAAIPEWLVATGAGRCQGQALACRREALTLGAGEVAKTEGGWLQKVLKKRNNRGSRRLDLKFYRKTVALSAFFLPFSERNLYFQNTFFQLFTA